MAFQVHPPTRMLLQCRVPWVWKQVSQTAQWGSVTSLGLCGWVGRRGRAQTVSFDIRLALSLLLCGPPAAGLHHTVTKPAVANTYMFFQSTIVNSPTYLSPSDAVYIKSMSHSSITLNKYTSEICFTFNNFSPPTCLKRLDWIPLSTSWT